MNRFKIISFYTVNTFYEEEIKRLETSIKQFKNIQYHFYPIESTGIWEKNTQLKAKILLTALQDFPDYNIVWLDADAIVVKYPELFETLKCDICIHSKPQHKKPEHRLLSGTIFLKNDDKIKTLIKEWIILNEKNNKPDQENLNTILSLRKDVSIQQLPNTYIAIKPYSMDVNDNTIRSDCFIYHTQASRKIRRGNETGIIVLG